MIRQRFEPAHQVQGNCRDGWSFRFSLLLGKRSDSGWRDSEAWNSKRCSLASSASRLDCATNSRESSMRPEGRVSSKTWSAGARLRSFFDRWGIRAFRGTLDGPRGEQRPVAQDRAKPADPRLIGCNRAADLRRFLLQALNEKRLFRASINTISDGRTQSRSRCA